VDKLPTTVAPSRKREFFDTIRHLRADQIWHLTRQRVLRRLLGGGLPRTPETVPPPRAGVFARGSFLPYPPAREFEPDLGRLTLLNLEAEHRLPIAWNRDDLPPLWVLELQYFHWLNPSMDPRQGLAYMNDWVQNQPDRHDTAAWNPFGVAMRILHWTRLLDAWKTDLESCENRQAILASLYRQARFLASRQEFELLGNHLLKTATGLYSAGCFFSGPEADRWKRTAAKILLGQAQAQTLPDGGHYERSPMYQLLVLLDLLDVLNMTSENTEWREELARVVRTQLVVARELMDPNGQIPLTNDSVLGQAPEPGAIIAYAKRMLNEPIIGKQKSGIVGQAGPSTSNLALPDFGLYRLTAGDWFCWVDAGLSGPDFLQAHAHADLGSVLAWLGGRPLLVEAGVCNYGGDSERRAYDRNAYGHNVLTLNGHGVCHCWREFRVGRRVGKLRTQFTPEPPCLHLEHGGFDFLTGKPTHERQVSLYPDKLLVVDRLKFQRPQPTCVEVLWHLDPAVTVEKNAENLHLSLGPYRLLVEWRGLEDLEIEYLPLARRFYRSETGPVVVLRGNVNHDTELKTCFRLMK
jgi:uncharacterized heparinase superfamily protein